MTNQDAVFAAGEGDRWFRRNRAALIGPTRLTGDPILRLLELTGLAPKEALEVGAANGYRLAELRRRYGCRATGVEISGEAIRDGQARYPEIDLRFGTASDLPIEVGRQFDLVVINFVLHWIDRSTLLRSAAEIDRAVKPLGYLAIGDFYPDTPERASYHHLPDAGVWTYKQNYAGLFLATQLYEQVALVTYEAGTQDWKVDVDPSRRCAATVLRKVGDDGYRTRRFTGAGPT
jgi:SAM-dependent methyltransferase